MNSNEVEGYALCIDMLSGYPAIYPLEHGWRPKIGDHVPAKICDGEGDVSLIVAEVITPADTAYSVVHHAYQCEDVPAMAELLVSLHAFAVLCTSAGSKFNPSRGIV